MILAVDLNHSGFRFVRSIQRRHRIFPAENIGGDGQILRPAEAQRIGGIGCIPVQDINMLVRPGNIFQA